MLDNLSKLRGFDRGWPGGCRLEVGFVGTVGRRFSAVNLTL
jgi:hypothetical protein